MKKANLPYGNQEMQVIIYRWVIEENGLPVERMNIHYFNMSCLTKGRKCKIPMAEEKT